MYSNRELRRLRAHKLVLHGRIARRRAVCVESAARLLQPVAWLDRAVVLVRRAAPYLPLAVLPFLWLLKPAGKVRLGALGVLLRWGPPIFQALRGLTATRHP